MAPTSHPQHPLCIPVQVCLNTRAPGVETVYGVRVPAKVPKNGF